MILLAVEARGPLEREALLLLVTCRRERMGWRKDGWECCQGCRFMVIKGAAGSGSLFDAIRLDERSNDEGFGAVDEVWESRGPLKRRRG